MQRGEIWWAQLARPSGSEPGHRRPVLIVQADSFNASRIQTTMVAAITSNLRLGDAPGNVRLSRRASKLPQPSVVNVSQVLTVDRSVLHERVHRLPDATMADVDAGLRLSLDL